MPKLSATLAFHIEDLEELITEQVQSNGYILEDITWEEGQATAHVRPMTLQEREAHELPTEPESSRIAREVGRAIEMAFEPAYAMLEEKQNVLDQLRKIDARIEGMSRTMGQLQRNEKSVVQESALPNARPESEDDTSDSDPDTASNVTSMRAAIEREVGDGLSRQQREDRAAYQARIQRIRQELEEGNSHPDLPDPSDRMLNKHEYETLPEDLRNA